MLSSKGIGFLLNAKGSIVFASDYEEPYSSDIKSLAISCSQPFVCKPR